MSTPPHPRSPSWVPALHDGHLECCSLSVRYRYRRRDKTHRQSASANQASISRACGNSPRGDAVSAARLRPIQFEVQESSDSDSNPNSHIVIVAWEGPNDPACPRNWPAHRKWLISSVGFAFCGLASISVSGYAISASTIQAELGCSRLLALSGITLYTVMFGIAPLLLAPLSEVYGRRIVYIASAAGFTVFQIPQAVASNIQTMLVARFLSAIGGSTAISLVGGTLSDLFSDDQRGVPMALFAFSAFAPTGLGPVIFGYTAMLQGFHLVFWIIFALASLLLVLIYFIQAETREGVLLSRKAARLRSTDNGDARNYTARGDEDMASFKILMKITLARPLRLLLTEPPIQAWTVYVSFAWGVLYLLLLSIPIVYSQIYAFSLGEIGLVYLAQILGSCLALPISLYCDKLYLARVSVKGPEARMYAGMIGGILVSAGAWIFAWTADENIHWSVPLVGVTVLYAGLLQIYLTAFNYVTDGYGTWASSALAAMNLGRNLVAAAVPLFGNQTYEALGIHGAGSLVAGLATALAAVPFVISMYGSSLRKRSGFAKERAAVAENP